MNPAAASLDGARYLLDSALSLLVLAVTVLALCDISLRRGLLRLAPMAACAAVVALVPPSTVQAHFAAAYLTAVGLALAAGLTPGKYSANLLAACGGLALGVTAGLQTATAAETAGTLAAAILLCILGLAVIRAVTHAVRHSAARLGRRIASAWIAAIGILLLALDLVDKRP